MASATGLFKYLDYVRSAIYTTNAVEAVHPQFRIRTKTKSGFANKNSLLKLLYSGILKALLTLDEPGAELEPNFLPAGNSL